MTVKFLSALALCMAVASGAAAQMAMGDDMGDMGQKAHKDKMMHGGMHGPIGVMGRHTLPKGKFMLTYRAGHMEMSGLRSGTTDYAPDVAATTLANRFAPPANLRVIPLSMEGDMQMVGGMYGLSDKVTLMAMVPYVKKSMTALTYSGMAGATRLGTNTMRSEGLGDIKVGALVGLHKKKRQRLTLGLGLSLPTGSITETGRMLMPNGARPVGRMAYSMQLGSGTYDLMPRLTWSDGKGRWNWGAQASGVIRLGSNDEGYSLGDKASVTAWTSYRAAKWVSYSARVEAETEGRIDGRDPLIGGAMPGTDPLNYGGETVSIYGGADFTVKRGALTGHKIGLEIGVPVYQRLNGPRLKRDWSLQVAWRKGF